MPTETIKNTKPDVLEIEDNLTSLAVLGEIVYHLSGSPTVVSPTAWGHLGNEIENRADRVVRLLDCLL